jgi:peptide-methionine (S)-S-oxide reductase
MRVVRLAAAALTIWAAGGHALAGHAVAIFAGGCFWCLEDDISRLPGVVDAETGYVGGSTPHPNYEAVSTGTTGHFEAVRVTFDPATTSYERLLLGYWLAIDPTDLDGQFCDRGPSGRSAIFVLDEDQRAAAQASVAEVAHALGAPVATAVLPAGAFWRAEELHQDYARKNPLRYQFYRRSCGRDARLRELWGDVPTPVVDGSDEAAAPGD